jgi:hypothetical protein
MSFYFTVCLSFHSTLCISVLSFFYSFSLSLCLSVSLSLCLSVSLSLTLYLSLSYILLFFSLSILLILSLCLWQSFLFSVFLYADATLAETMSARFDRRLGWTQHLVPRCKQVEQKISLGHIQLVWAHSISFSSWQIYTGSIEILVLHRRRMLKKGEFFFSWSPTYFVLQGEVLLSPVNMLLCSKLPCLGWRSAVVTYDQLNSV